MKCCQYQKKVAYCWISSWDKPSRAERGGSKLWVRSGLAGILYQRLICCVNKHVGFMLLPRGRGQQLHLLHTMSDACTLWSWMDFSHEKGVCLEALGIQKLLIALLCETGVWIKSYGAISFSPSEALVLHASHLNHKASPLAEGTSDLETCSLTMRCVNTPTPKLGLSQHIHPSVSPQ